MRGNDLIRVSANAFQSSVFALVGAQVQLATPNPTRPGDPFVGNNAAWFTNADWPVPPNDGLTRIGQPNSVETQFPAAWAVRQQLGFRGDPFTDTASNAFSGGAQVLPVHRFEFGWTVMGNEAARAGRLDRVALLSGIERSAGNVPSVEWHTVNWVKRRYNYPRTPANLDPSSTVGSYFGDHPFQLVAFQAPLTGQYTAFSDQPSYGAGEDQDVRFYDRMVKYPSGELPAEDLAQATFGSSPAAGAPDARGILDEIQLLPRRSVGRLLVADLDEGGRSFVVRPDVLPLPEGTVPNSGVPSQWRVPGDFPGEGAMVRIGAELLAVASYSPGTGEFQIAQNGRGLLGTEPTSHAAGERVYFVDEIPVAILVGGVVPRDSRFQVAGLGSLPRNGGTLLVGRTELAHYTWTAGDNLIGMPQFYPTAFDVDGLGPRTPRGPFSGSVRDGSCVRRGQ